jgi:hypothetical protein
LEFGEGRSGPIIVIARAAVNRRLDLGNEVESFVEIFDVFDKIAGETNKVGLE